MSGHTPTPWHVGNGGNPHGAEFEVRSYVGDEDVYLFGITWGNDFNNPNAPSLPESEANAALIVRAVNNHDRLVEALSNIAGGRGIEGLADAFVQGNASSAIDSIQQYARQALAAAKGVA